MSARRAAPTRAVLVLMAVVVGAVLAVAVPADAQEGSATSAPTTSSSVAELPPSDMIPRPDSGQPPSEAGDRGGGLQLLVLGLLLAAVGLGVAKLVRDARRARAGGGPA